MSSVPTVSGSFCVRLNPKQPLSLSPSYSFFLFLLFLSKRDSSMQAPSQNSPLCAYQPSGPAQSYSTATTLHPCPLFKEQETPIWRKKKRGLQMLQAAAVIKTKTRVCRWTTTTRRRGFIILIAVICVFYLPPFCFSSLLSHHLSFSSTTAFCGLCSRSRVVAVFVGFFGKL